MKDYYYVIYLLFSIILISNLVGTVQWKHTSWLDKNNNYLLRWNFDDDREMISFLVEVKTRGWLGFGLSPTGQMKNSDVIIGWIADNGKTYFHDHFAYDLSMPTVDESQDWKLLESAQNTTHTIFQFSRPYRTCDDLHDLQIKRYKTGHIIFSYAERDPDCLDEIKKHDFRGTKKISLIDYKETDYVKPSDLDYFDFSVTNFSPQFTHGNEELVHHITVYSCGSQDNTQLLKYISKKSFYCSNIEFVPEELSYCTKTYFTWTPGGGSFIAPPEGGYALGADEETTFLMVQVHYFNPEMLSNRIDSSVIRAFHTSVLRQYELSQMGAGSVMNYGLILPPHQSKFKVAGHCNTQCFENIMPKNGIKIISMIHHTHSAGIAVKTRHFRGQKELAHISDENYKFNFQQNIFLKVPINLMPGDQLTTECTYDTSSRNQTTLGGETSSKEMCLSALIYYPRIKNYSQMCFSGLSKSTIMIMIGAEEIEGFTSSIDPTMIFTDGRKNLSLSKYLTEKTQWSSKTQDIFLNNEQRQACYLAKDKKDESQEKYVSYPKNLMEHKPEKTECKTNKPQN